MYNTSSQYFHTEFVETIITHRPILFRFVTNSTILYFYRFLAFVNAVRLVNSLKFTNLITIRESMVYQRRLKSFMTPCMY